MVIKTNGENLKAYLSVNSCKITIFIFEWLLMAELGTCQVQSENLPDKNTEISHHIKPLHHWDYSITNICIHPSTPQRFNLFPRKESFPETTFRTPLTLPARRQIPPTLKDVCKSSLHLCRMELHGEVPCVVVFYRGDDGLDKLQENQQIPET